MKKINLLFVLFFFVITISFTQESNTLIVDSLLNKLWQSDDNYQKSRIIKKIEKQNPVFDDLLYSIKNKIEFSDYVKKGFVEWENKIDSIFHFCIVLVPNSYNPTKKYPVTVFLHGAIMNLNPHFVQNIVTPSSYNLDSLEKIIVYPTSWMQSLWWSNRQVENLKYIITRLKQTYNIDENNIHLTGISDGATGIFYQLNMNSTLWASIKPYIGDPNSTANLSNHEIYLKNYKSVPWLIVNTSNDELFPASEITPFVDKMKQEGASINYYIMNNFDHDLKWYPLLKDTVQLFTERSIRNPFPSEIYWRTENTTKYGRNKWVIIDKLGKNKNLDNSIVLTPKSQKESVFSGSIDAKTIGNTIYVKTFNVKQYTLLISPEQFDFNKPIIVYTNDNLSFEGIVEKNYNVLLNWFSKDLDRLMLYGYELNIQIK
ncbi:MAG: hypothetical protein A2041_11570 [Bacteroidetes bacterium GWA2_31_9b]|nr:MAG: hypothetical protein A2041_11570 [Bacteroidetes bacterium GWA2_31_9b]